MGRFVSQGFGFCLSGAAFASAFNGDEANSAEEEHDYSDYDTKGQYVHFIRVVSFK